MSIDKMLTKKKLPLAALGAIFALAAAGPASALTVEAGISAAFQKKLEKDYGTREARLLTDTLKTKIEREFKRRGVSAERVVVTIEDAKPNKPTMQQVADRPGLDAFHSISIGGAHVTGIAYNLSGAEIGRLDYDWYETDITNTRGLSTWGDARWTFDRFAHRFADKLS